MMKYILLILSLSYCLTFASGLIVCTSSKEQSCLEVLHTEASFSKPLPFDPTVGVRGKLQLIKENLCDITNMTSFPELSMIMTQRGECDFYTKAKNAEKLGAESLIIYDNIRDEELIIMGSRDKDSTVDIPVIFLASIEAIAVGEYNQEHLDDTYGMLYKGDNAYNYWNISLCTFFRIIMSNVLFILFVVSTFVLLKRAFKCLFLSKKSSLPITNSSTTNYGYFVLEEQQEEDKDQKRSPSSSSLSLNNQIILGVPIVSGVNDFSTTTSLGVPICATQGSANLV